MDKLIVLQGLLQKLQAASLNGQWLVVLDIDRQIQQQLNLIQAEEQDTTELRAILQRMAKVHHGCLQYCQQQSKELEAKLIQYRRYRDGLAAYANLGS